MIKKLTPEILDKIIKEVILDETREKEHCEDLKPIEKLKCHSYDDESRDRSAAKTAKRKEILEPHLNMMKLARGIVTEEPEENNFKYKLQNFVKTLNKLEKGSFSKIVKRPSTKQMFLFCNDLISASKGSMDDDKRKELELKLKAKKEQNE